MIIDPANRANICEKMATDIVEGMDMDDLIEYAVTQMTNYFNNLDDAELSEEVAEYGYLYGD